MARPKARARATAILDISKFCNALVPTPTPIILERNHIALTMPADDLSGVVGLVAASSDTRHRDFHRRGRLTGFANTVFVFSGNSEIIRMFGLKSFNRHIGEPGFCTAFPLAAGFAFFNIVV